jgi:hypothetical protein
MSIKLKLRQLVLAMQSQALTHVAEAIPPGGYHFRVSKLLSAVDVELTNYQKQNQALVRKYGKPDEKGNINVAEAEFEAQEAFNLAMAELGNQDVVIPYEPIIWSKLGEEAQKKLTIRDVHALGALLVETEDEAAPTPSESAKG